MHTEVLSTVDSPALPTLAAAEAAPKTPAEPLAAHAVLLADTILYPEGGGQPSDRGSINGTEVLEVRRTAEGIVHFAAAPIEPGPAVVRLDWHRRFDHMQQHTGQHLLTAVAENRFGWSTTAFHLGPEVSDIELAVPKLATADLRALEEAVAEEIRRARPIRPRRVSHEAFAGMEVRTRGLPEELHGDIRLVEIEGLDRNTCGGTHLRSTAEIEAVVLLGTEPMRGGTRVYFIAGWRVRRRMAAHEERNASLRTVLGAPDDALVEAAGARIAALDRSAKAARRVEEELADLHGDLLASRVAAAPGGVVDAHFDERDGSFLQRCGRRFASVSPGGVAFLTATPPELQAGSMASTGGAFFVVAAGEHRASVPRTLGPRIAELLKGRGGGSASLYQGKVASLAHRSAAFALLQSKGSDG